MKRLKKILLVNWLYFQKQLIEVDDISFLTGKNGAGKSTIIDALQIVFLGETNSKNFNRAANEGSQRPLDGYLRADMDPNNPYSRRGKDFSSYIACEFYDDVNAEAFVIGITFDCRSDGGRQERYFSYTGTIPESCFLVGNLPMDIPALRKYLKSSYGARGKLFDSHKEYRSDMLASRAFWFCGRSGRRCRSSWTRRNRSGSKAPVNCPRSAARLRKSRRHWRSTEDGRTK